jgi:hypothetical protein
MRNAARDISIIILNQWISYKTKEFLYRYAVFFKISYRFHKCVCKPNPKLSSGLEDPTDIFSWELGTKIRSQIRQKRTLTRKTDLC